METLIRLTPEILIEMGFLEKLTHSHFQIKQMSFDIYPDHVIGYFEDNEYGHEKEDEIRFDYLHQLQNFQNAYK